ncbi:MAG: CDP-alcohol phosphatidyltransferase family protein [Bauldia sp.]
MFDDALRDKFRTPVDRLGRWLARQHVSALQLTGLGFLAGVGGCVALSVEAYGIAFGCLVLNRIADLLDGAVARATEVTDFGGFIDILADLLIYSGFVLGFALGRPHEAIPALILIYTFLATGAAFLAAANIAARRRITKEPAERKSFFYRTALAEGSETAVYLGLICTLPDYFAILSYVFAALGWLSLGGYLIWASKFR